MVVFYLLTILSFANDLYFLIELPIEPSDIGLSLLFLGLAIVFVLQRRDFSVLANFTSFFVIAYLLIVVAQASMASFFFGQTILNGLVVARHQFYWLSLPLFVLLLRSPERMHTLLNALIALMLLVVFLSLVNYFVEPIFHHKWAEGHGVRSGMIRAYVPATQTILICCLWSATKYFRGNSHRILYLFFFIVFFGTLLFRQTRALIIASTIAVFLMLVYERKFGSLLALFLLAVAVSMYMSVNSEQNILIAAFTDAYADISSNQGTWAARTSQVKQSFDNVIDTFWTGNGALVLRATEGSEAEIARLRPLSRNMDLGYWVWVKFFGLPGVLLMLSFFVWYAKEASAALGRDSSQVVSEIAHFAVFALLGILIATLTLPYFTEPRGIVAISLVLALMLNAKYARQEGRKPFAVQPGDPQKRNK